MTIETPKPKSSPFVRRCQPVLFALSVAPFVTGCGSTAIIARRDGLQSQGRITGSNKNNVYVESENGGVRAISRANIEDIDHPGNVAAGFGLAVTAYGIANIAVGAPQYCDGRAYLSCAGVFLPAGIGAALIAYGGAVWQRPALRTEATRPRHIPLNRPVHMRHCTCRNLPTINRPSLRWHESKFDRDYIVEWPPPAGRHVASARVCHNPTSPKASRPNPQFSLVAKVKCAIAFQSYSLLLVRVSRTGAQCAPLRSWCRGISGQAPNSAWSTCRYSKRASRADCV